MTNRLRFSELALLLPNTDLTLVFFGKAVANLVTRARKESPGSLATRETIWEYKSPQKTGGGSLKIRLDSDHGIWTRATISDSMGPGNLPDALVGLNAGVASYSDWMEPVLISAM